MRWRKGNYPLCLKIVKIMVETWNLKLVIVYFFWHFSVFLIKFSYWLKFHANVITGSGVSISVTISFYKGLTRNPEIRNTTVSVLLDICRLVWARNTKFDPSSLIECYWMLKNVRATAFTVSELLKENLLARGVNPPPPQD